MEGHCSTGQSPQRAVVPMEEEEEEGGGGGGGAGGGGGDTHFLEVYRNTKMVQIFVNNIVERNEEPADKKVTFPSRF